MKYFLKPYFLFLLILGFINIERCLSGPLSTSTSLTSSHYPTPYSGEPIAGNKLPGVQQGYLHTHSLKESISTPVQYQERYHAFQKQRKKPQNSQTVRKTREVASVKRPQQIIKEDNSVEENGGIISQISNLFISRKTPETPLENTIVLNIRNVIEELEQNGGSIESMDSYLKANGIENINVEEVRPPFYLPNNTEIISIRYNKEELFQKTDDRQLERRAKRSASRSPASRCPLMWGKVPIVQRHENGFKPLHTYYEEVRYAPSKARPCKYFSGEDFLKLPTESQQKYLMFKETHSSRYKLRCRETRVDYKRVFITYWRRLQQASLSEATVLAIWVADVLEAECR